MDVFEEKRISRSCRHTTGVQLLICPPGLLLPSTPTQIFFSFFFLPSFFLNMIPSFRPPYMWDAGGGFLFFFCRQARVGAAPLASARTLPASSFPLTQSGGGRRGKDGRCVSTPLPCVTVGGAAEAEDVFLKDGKKRKKRKKKEESVSHLSENETAAPLVAAPLPVVSLSSTSFSTSSVLLSPTKAK